MFIKSKNPEIIDLANLLKLRTFSQWINFNQVERKEFGYLAQIGDRDSYYFVTDKHIYDKNNNIVSLKQLLLDKNIKTNFFTTYINKINNIARKYDLIFELTTENNNQTYRFIQLK